MKAIHPRRRRRPRSLYRLTSPRKVLFFQQQRKKKEVIGSQFGQWKPVNLFGLSRVASFLFYCCSRGGFQHCPDDPKWGRNWSPRSAESARVPVRTSDGDIFMGPGATRGLRGH